MSETEHEELKVCLKLSTRVKGMCETEHKESEGMSETEHRELKVCVKLSTKS